MVLSLSLFWGTGGPVVTSPYGNCQSGKMATEPNKTEILTIFKRLRSIPTNKVTEINTAAVLVILCVNVTFTGSCPLASSAVYICFLAQLSF